ncbi:MAG TPA: hypothetical protein VFR58_00675 [Flavisolibacter sp.]|nr:hypothetical protein [Flavisolibacter sp.]
MKQFPKLILILAFLASALSGMAQEDPPDGDETFTAVLLVIGSLFICAMIGAAIIGAMWAALMLFIFFGLVAVGGISVSVFYGLHKRSYKAGFKSFLLFLFGFSCLFIGGAGSYLIASFTELPVTASEALLIGMASGLTGGLLMALATYRLFGSLIGFMSKRLMNKSA